MTAERSSTKVRCYGKCVEKVLDDTLPMTAERSSTKVRCYGKCIGEVLDDMSARYGAKLEPLNVVTNMRTGGQSVAVRCEYRRGRHRKFANVLGEYCPFCGGKIPS